MKNPCLQINRLNCHFSSPHGNVWTVRDFSIEVFHGQTLGIVGESGCGKSTICKAIMGLLPDGTVTEGSEILFEGNSIFHQPKKKFRSLLGNQISMIFQEPSKALNPVLRVGKQIIEVLQTHRKISKKSAKEKVISLLEELGLDQPGKVWKMYPHQLSGGQQQRIAIAQALICSPRLIIADEPTTALDATVQAGILEILIEQQKRRDLTIVLVSHDLALISKMADRIAVIYAGRLVELSDADSLFNRPLMPYSAGLIQANPVFNPSHKKKLRFIPGLPPNMAETITGCAFAPRCLRVKDKCKKQIPPFKKVRQNQFVACFNPLLDHGI
ncbi:MAG: ABC transporter ATP-binding protein [Desulfobacula sp.]|nr:ABC transporter ATP-binding protein [Desulfobacula sp.]